MNPRSQVKLREEYLLITNCAEKNQRRRMNWRRSPRQQFSSRELPAVVHRNITALVAAQIDLAWPRNFLLRIEQHFLPLRDPA